MRIKEIIACITGTGGVMYCCDEKAGRQPQAGVSLLSETALALRHRRPKRNKAAYLVQPKKASAETNDIWRMDFLADAMFDGRRLRPLLVVDNYISDARRLMSTRA